MEADANLYKASKILVLPWPNNSFTCLAFLGVKWRQEGTLVACKPNQESNDKSLELCLYDSKNKYL